MKQLTTPNMVQCIGCHSCTLACAREVYKKIGLETAGIRIQSAGGLSTGFIALRCLSCAPSPCVTVCPTEALTQRPGGGVVFKKNECIRCGNCVEACPVDGISQDREGNIYVCIHCGICVRFCPQGCLEMIDTGGGETDGQ